MIRGDHRCAGVARPAKQDRVLALQSGRYRVVQRLTGEFAGPMVTFYQTLRTAYHPDSVLAHIGTQIVTVPFDRIDASDE